MAPIRHDERSSPKNPRALVVFASGRSKTLVIARSQKDSSKRPQCVTSGANRCIRLLGQEVIPAVREVAKEFDLKSPFETNQPVSIDYMDHRKEPVRAAAE